VGGMWIYNTEFCRNFAPHIEYTNKFILHARKDESLEAIFIKLTCNNVEGTWIQNTEFILNLATEIENSNRFMLHARENKESCEANFISPLKMKRTCFT
jgi:hypothetical protein